MVIKETLSNEDIANLNDFIKQYNSKNEMEISFFQKSDFLSMDRFNKLNNVLHIITKNNKKEYTMTTETMLDVIFSYKNEENVLINYRITITGLDKINEYIQMLGEKKNEVIFSALLKMASSKSNDNLKIIKKVKNFSKYILIENYFMKIKMDEELEVSKDELKKLSEVHNNFSNTKYNIIYRLKNRNSYYITKHKNIFKVDLTLTKQSHRINSLENSVQNKEIELECLIENKKTIVDEMFLVSEFIIKIIQQTEHIVSANTQKEILNIYKNLLGINENIDKLYGRKTVSLEIVHAVDNLPNKYAVTDKADGERNQLITHNNKCYLISNNLIVKDIGVDVKSQYNNSIVDGEYIFVKKNNKYLYMVFDCLVISGINMRNEINFMKRLSSVDELINNINKIDIVFNEINDINDINKLVQNHKKNLYLMYVDIENSLTKTKNTIIIRKKYFIDVYGLKDNEIFYYSDFLWNIYTLDSKLKCPYELDGLIYQPLEQKYETDIKKSKYPDLKWKPAKLNSIDFYIEFEKDKNTGKIIILYDNTLITVNDDIEEIELEKNKQYLICNLYVGNKINNVEQPQLFSNDPKEYQCYLYLDETNNVRSIDGMLIYDKTVVEFYYDMKSELSPNMRWTPMRTRHDKTDKVNTLKIEYGNNYYISKLIWNTILNPFTENNFKELMDDSKYEYYIKQLKQKIISSGAKVAYYSESISFKHDPYTQFNNYVKSQLIYTYMNMYYNDTQYKILDLGSGRGGDLQKFYYASIISYVGIEPDYENIYAHNNALSRYAKLKKSYANVPPMTFIQSSATCLFTYEDQIKEIGKMNNEQQKLFDKFFGHNNTTYFDRVNSSFSLHYYLNNEISWLNCCNNIDKYLRPGGYFVFEVFDANKIKELLKNKETHQVFYNTPKGEKKLLFEIKKKYNDNSKSFYGNAIDVNMAWIMSDPTIFYTEYLVDYDFIIQSLKENCNMELIESDVFENVYNDNYLYLKTVVEQEKKDTTQLKNLQFASKLFKFYEDTELNKLHREYSFLSRYYVFKKEEKDLKNVKKNYYGKKSTIYTNK